MREKIEVDFQPGYGIVSTILPRNTVKTDTVRVHYQGKVARTHEGNSRLIGQFLEPESHSYVYADGTISLAFRTPPTEAGSITIEYEWEPSSLLGCKIQILRPSGDLEWIPIEELQGALRTSLQQV